MRRDRNIAHAHLAIEVGFVHLPHEWLPSILDDIERIELHWEVFSVALLRSSIRLLLVPKCSFFSCILNLCSESIGLILLAGLFLVTYTPSVGYLAVSLRLLHICRGWLALHWYFNFRGEKAGLGQASLSFAYLLDHICALKTRDVCYQFPSGVIWLEWLLEVRLYLGHIRILELLLVVGDTGRGFLLPLARWLILTYLNRPWL